jgi:hypothetical protein
VSRITLADRARAAVQWEVAARLYRQALERNPRNPPIWVQYGHALKESGSLAEAEAAYRRAIADEPRNADSHLQLGHVLKMQRKTAAAEACYLRALALDPSPDHPPHGLSTLGWSEADVNELHGLLGVGASHPVEPSPTKADEPRGRSTEPAPNGIALLDIRSPADAPRDAACDHSATIHAIAETKAPQSIAYITNRHDPATMRYRVYNYAAAFRSAGIAITTVDFEEASFADVEHADVLVFCRVPETPALCEIIARFRSMGRPVVYDIDDLVFDPDRIEYLRATKRADPERTDLVRALLTGTLAMMRHFDLVTVSTFALKLEVERLGKAAHVIPNTLAPSEARPGDARAPAIPPRGRRAGDLSQRDGYP